jgi:hypothetical protein
VYAIETKTWSKPSPTSTITVEGDSLLVAGRAPNRNPIIQVTAAARWLARKLEESTGKKFAVRGVEGCAGPDIGKVGPMINLTSFCQRISFLL